ncbi:MAG: peptidase S8 [Candidatus Baltobacteraceae bacterium]
MNFRNCAFIALALLLPACGGGGGGSAIPSGNGNGSSLPPGNHATPTPSPAPSPVGALQHACPPAAPGTATCYALIRTDSVNLQPMLRRFLAARRDDATYSGPLRPADIESLYRLPATYTGSRVPTIAIVDAYDDPNAEADLSHYRKYFGLPQCTSSNGCFKKVNQSGASGSFPGPDTGWSGEISLDLDAASAACPTCRIALVEASSNSWQDLGTAEDTAAGMNPAAISNSYGGAEYLGASSHYTHPNTIVTASTGDNSFYGGPQQPASYATVVAVGGTSLYHNVGVSRGWNELAWSNGGSGCSSMVSRPSWQNPAITGCMNRSEADISAFADPFNPGIWVWNSYTGGAGSGGWYVDGGTSAASPLVAAMYALANNASALGGGYAQSIWLDAGRSTFDVTQGNNGYCNPIVQCAAAVGYDGPSGWGAPNGLGAF